jgi:hypothetical protein
VNGGGVCGMVGIGSLAKNNLKGCPKSLEPMGILIIFYFYLHVKVKDSKAKKWH